MIICCIQTGNYCGEGANYVNRLYKMLRKNITFSFNFVCFTDDSTGLDSRIIPIALPVPELTGWWHKLSLFKPGVFPKGERVWFFDLDTLITGNLDDILGYKGQFATLRDFYHPQFVGPAIMSWTVNDYTSGIWTAWEGAGRPQEGLGDLWWINGLDQGRFAKEATKLQDAYPHKFVSYKVHCETGLPKGAAVVCFHGEPKNHNCGGWAQWEWENA